MRKKFRRIFVDTESPTAEVPVVVSRLQQMDTAELPVVITDIDKFRFQIQTACELTLRAIKALGDSRRYNKSPLPETRQVYAGQFRQFLESFNDGSISDSALKAKIRKNIDYIKKIIADHEGSIFVRDLKRARKSLLNVIGEED